MQGTSPAVVRRAIADGDALPGTRGFAGAVDGALVRDVLGRYPLFSDREEPGTWSADPTDLASPVAVPAGHRRGLPGGGAPVGEDAATGADPDADEVAPGAEQVDSGADEIDPGTDEVDPGADERLWSLPSPEPFASDARAVAAVRAAVTRSVDEVESDDALPVAFSGGLDSAILAARLDGPLYVGGFEGSHDVAAARETAATLEREDDLHVVEFTHGDVERAVPAVVRATGRSDPMAVQIAVPLYLVAERVAADGHGRLALGGGADELFGGYQKVARAADDDRLEADTVRAATREVVATLPEQCERDVLALRAAGVEPLSPLLHDRVASAALRLPGHLLAAGGERKVALRRAAAFLPGSVRRREKKAVQYGSLVARELDRLARQAGFKRRIDDHIGRYVDSLLD